MLNLGVRRCKMAKKQKIDLQSVGVLAALAFAWTKLGLGAAVKDLTSIFPREYPPKEETGYLTQAEWQALYGGSQLDYEDWLRGQ